MATVPLAMLRYLGIRLRIWPKTTCRSRPARAGKWKTGLHVLAVRSGQPGPGSDVRMEQCTPSLQCRAWLQPPRARLDRHELFWGKVKRERELLTMALLVLSSVIQAEVTQD